MHEYATDELVAMILAASPPITVAYADPPYPGQAHRYPEKQEVDHESLIWRLAEDYPDGWALSTSSPSLRMLLPLCPPDVRVLAWVKPYAPNRPNVNPIYSWEPIIARVGRKGKKNPHSCRDWLEKLPTPKNEQAVLGQKSLAFCHWLFTCLGLMPHDTLDDLFPGSGAVGAAWATYPAYWTDRIDRMPAKHRGLIVKWYGDA